MTEHQKTFFDGVLAEYAYAENKHQSWPSGDAVHAASILNEEAGKLTRAANDYTFGLLPPTEAGPDLRKYAMRVAAMAMRFCDSLPEYKPL